ncbi:MAG: 50S ribosomal protein L11 methyltransferase [Candidatus Peribacteraceae bacterium]|jgi:protein arginine N-methyltransferase 1|nr:50S ribosomal protein L11 methyltransferase [Candidatus Peribacteraceae bacterium]
MIEYQRIILADHVRNEVFARALKAVVRKDESVVADIGSGTGFLSFLASKLGAKECYLYEQSALLDLSRSLAHENDIKHLHFIQKHSTQVRTPVKADVVISETLGNFALEEGIIETMNDAQRLLKPDGVLIPQSLQQFIVPVVSDHLWKEVTSFDRVGHGLTFRKACEISCQNIYVRTLQMSDLLPDGAQTWDEIDFTQKNSPLRSATLTWIIHAPVTVFGFGLWWEAELQPGITLSTSPAAPRTHWEQIFMPVLEPLELRKGEQLTLSLSVDARQEIRINVAWDIRAISADGGERKHQRLDMRRGQIG